METLPGEKKSKEIKENVSTIVLPSSPFSCHYFHRHEHQSHHHRLNHLLTKFWGWRFWLIFEISDVIVPTFIIFVTHNDNPCHLASKRFGGMAHVTCHITCYLTFRFLGLAGWPTRACGCGCSQRGKEFDGPDSLLIRYMNDDHDLSGSIIIIHLWLSKVKNQAGF